MESLVTACMLGGAGGSRDEAFVNLLMAQLTLSHHLFNLSTLSG